MSVTLVLRTQDDQISARHEGNVLATTAVGSLPTVALAQTEPGEAGARLLAALGGAALLALLPQSGGCLTLDIPPADPADAVPWEFARLPNGQYLACLHDWLRQVDAAAPPLAANAAAGLQLIALGADPLVDERGQAREGYRLQLDREMRQVRRALRQSGKQVAGYRIPPTFAELRRALSRPQPTWLHLSCHGQVIATANGPLARLLLEDDNGKLHFLTGPDLATLAPGHAVRLALLGACATAEGQANLARALVHNGLPAAIGMQGLFMDRLSDDLAGALYEALLQEQDVAAAVRQARLALLSHPQMVGLPVLYARRGGAAPLPLPPGRADLQWLDVAANLRLPLEVRSPRTLLGRNRELHDLARLLHPDAGAPGAGQPEICVATITGTGGMGKTALAAAFVERFAWRWPDGVVGVSFAAGEVDAARFRGELLERITGDAAADLPPARQEERLAQAVRDWDGLILVDNYESVQQAIEGTDAAGQAAGQAIHRVLLALARAGAGLLLTSRQNPVGLPGERLFPEGGRALAGLGTAAGAELFFQYAPTAAGRREERRYQQLAAAVAAATAGHPLAIALLGSEFQNGDVPPQTFLQNWAAELAAASSLALDPHHRTFAAAFNRSYEQLAAAQQARLRALSLYGYPFFAAGAYYAWNGPAPEPPADAALAQTQAQLRELTGRTLLEVDAFYGDGTPATYRFQPAVQQAAAARLDAAERAALPPRLAGYAYWLAQQGYGDIHRDMGLNRVVRLALESLPPAAAHLSGTARLWHLRRVGWLLNAYGQTKLAYQLLQDALAEARALAEDEEALRLRSSLLYELAGLETTRGDLERALALYTESLQYLEQIGDIQGKAASLHQMAQVFLTRGDLERALALYTESLQYDEQIGDIQGKAASLSGLANLYMRNKDWEKAEQLVQEALALAQRLGDLQEIAFDTAKLGQVAEARGDLETARSRYSAALRLFQQLGMPRETAQVQQMLATVGETTTTEDEVAAMLAQLPPAERAQAEAQLQQLAQQLANMSQAEKAQLVLLSQMREAVNQANAGAARGLLPNAIAQQQAAVHHARRLAEETNAQEAWVQLSVLLYNLAGYHRRAGQHGAAVACLEEVVFLDERTGHPDLESDRAALAQAQAALAQSPADAANEAELTPEQAAQLAAFARQLEQMPPAEQAALRRQLVTQSLLQQAGEIVVNFLRGDLDAAAAAQAAGEIESVAAQVAADEEMGLGRQALADFLRAAAHRLRRPAQPAGPAAWPPVPAAYAEQVAQIEAAAQEP